MGDNELRMSQEWPVIGLSRHGELKKVFVCLSGSVQACK